MAKTNFFRVLAAAVMISGLVAISGPAWAQGQAKFAPAHNYGVGDGPQSGISADFNGDGKLDLAIPNANSNNVSVLLGNGDGTFQAAQNFPVGGGPISVTSADFNDDGKLDLAVAHANPNNVSVLLGNGDGTFQAAQNVDVAAGSGVGSVTSTDFNDDGESDLAIVTNSFSSSGDVSVLLGNGDGTFGAPQPFGVGSGPRTVISADFNTRGGMDLAVANNGSDDVSVLLGNGRGGFGAPQNFPAGGGPSGITSADFDANGEPDLAVANAHSDDVSVLLDHGDVNFDTQNFGAGDLPVSVTSADFDGDGKLDLAVANANSNNVSVLLGKGDGIFEAAQNFTVGDVPVFVTAGDFNGDGRADLAVANFNSDNVSVLLNASGDNTPPTIALTTPADRAIYRLGRTVNANYTCADETGGSGLRSCAGDVPSGSPIDTSTVGAKTFTVAAEDNAGNKNSVTHTYIVSDKHHKKHKHKK
jgi:hypothetical protein